MNLGTFLKKWQKNGIFETFFMGDGALAHLAVSIKQWHQRCSVKGQTLLQLAQEQPRTQVD